MLIAARPATPGGEYPGVVCGYPRSGFLDTSPRQKPEPHPVSTRPFDLVIFDCDGVLVDSESITNRVVTAMLNEIGLRVTLADMFDRIVGHSMAHCLGLDRGDWVTHHRRSS